LPWEGRLDRIVKLKGDDAELACYVSAVHEHREASVKSDLDDVAMRCTDIKLFACVGVA
jgi:hypothetical protein